ncbi:hypothetical protein ACI6PS_09615 [Flavobacterium sp. PLA-1-15]|uniref:hypothetical protein n=1 Tax=Flavobacterium sp. PLA-1-15 TaxID=3380533 RepID=UPI003B7895C4
MEWYKNLFKKQTAAPVRQRVAELTEFELSESHKILLDTENIIEGLLQHISDQREIIVKYEEELRKLKYTLRLDTEEKKRQMREAD